jgi:hypothetical protein
VALNESSRDDEAAVGVGTEEAHAEGKIRAEYECSVSFELTYVVISC